MIARLPTIAAWIQIALPVLMAGCRPPASPDNATGVTLTAEFRALWWSVDQMESLNLESPPPRDTEVVLKKWEYTDPVGVPNPDKVDLLVTLGNPTNQALASLEVRGVTRWKEGPITDENQAEWRPGDTLASLPVVDLARDATATVRFRDIDLKGMQDRLFREKRWPWALEVRLSVVPSGSPATILAETVVNLPIRPGD